MAEANERMESHSTANSEFHRTYGRYFWWFTGAALAIHVLIIFFFVTPRGGGFEARAEELEVIEIPPEIKIPPPPEEPVEEDITIAETEIIEDAPLPEAPPPAPAAEPEVGSNFTFTPYTVKPKCQRGCAAADILRNVPPLLRRSGVSCDLTVGIRIDTSGNVTATDLLKSSGNSACDQAAEQWARTTRWSTAYNRDQPVVVWIAQPVSIKTE